MPSPRPQWEQVVQGAGPPFSRPLTHPGQEPGLPSGDGRACAVVPFAYAVQSPRPQASGTAGPSLSGHLPPPTIWRSCGFLVSCPGHGTLHGFSPCRAQALAPDLPCVPLPCALVPLLGSFVKFSTGCELPFGHGVRDAQPGHGCRVALRQ